MRKVSAAHSLPLLPVQRLGRVRRTQPFRKKRERLETRIIAVFSLAAKVKEKAIEVAIVMQNAQLSGHRVQPTGFVSPVYA